MSDQKSEAPIEFAAPPKADIASRNADGSLNWFIPPFVIPAVFVAAIIARAISTQL
jgi:hypothetical protein